MKEIKECPECNKPLSLRKPMSGQAWNAFYGCTGYPNCKYSEKYSDPNGSKLKELKFVKKVSTDFDMTIVKKVRRNRRKTEPKIPIDISGVTPRNFSYIRFPYKEFNPLQKMVIPHIDNDVNIVVCSATSSGKTSIAEMIFGRTLHEGNGCIYLSPLRALSQEKFTRWRHESHPFSEYRTVLQTGDVANDSEAKGLLACADIIIQTSEMLHHKSIHIGDTTKYLLDIGALVVDEAHLLDEESRGSELEAGLEKFTRINPHARLVFLSATMQNYQQLADWLTILNGKQTIVIESKYRPCELKVHYEPITHMKGNSARTELEYIETAVNITQQFPDDKFICFVHSKKTGYKLVEALEPYEGVVPFHSRDLARKDRIKAETDFMLKQGGLRVIVATSTLAMGLDMPARRVIIVGTRRANELVKASEINQECVHPSSLILTPKGIKRAFNVKLHDVVNTSGKTTGVVNSIINNNTTEFINIKTRYGSSLFLTRNHPVFIDDKQEFINADKIVVGDKLKAKLVFDSKNKTTLVIDLLDKKKTYVSVTGELFDFCVSLAGSIVKAGHAFGIKRPKDFSQYRNRKAGLLSKWISLCEQIGVNKAFLADNIISYKSRSGNITVLPKTVNSDMAWLMGMLATDGNVQRTSDYAGYGSWKCRWFNSNPTILAKIERIISGYNLNFYKEAVNDSINPTYAIEVSSPLLCEVARRFKIHSGNKSLTLKFPYWILNASENVRGSYIAGLFDGDGSYDTNKGIIRFGSGSARFRNGVNRLLRTFGLLSVLDREKQTGKGEFKPNQEFFYTLRLAGKLHYNKYCRLFSKYSCKQLKIVDIINEFNYLISNEVTDHVKSVRVVKLNTLQPTVNFFIEGKNEYFVEGILTHNCGRAGRPAYDKQGDAHILVDSSIAHSESIRLAQPFIVTSCLTDPNNLIFHVLFSIYDGAKNEQDIFRWYSRTLASLQKKEVSFEELTQITESLRNMGMIKILDSGDFKILSLGKICCWFYINPKDVFGWKKGFDHIKKVNQRNPEGVIWAMTKANCYYSDIANQLQKFDCDEVGFSLRVHPSMRQMSPGQLKHASALFCIMNDFPIPKYLVSVGAQWKNEIERVAAAIKSIDSFCGKWEMESLVNRAALSVVHGVTFEQAELATIKGIGKKRAQKLIDNGISTLKDILIKKTEVKKLLGPKIGLKAIESAQVKTAVKLRKSRS